MTRVELTNAAIKLLREALPHSEHEDDQAIESVEEKIVKALATLPSKETDLDLTQREIEALLTVLDEIEARNSASEGGQFRDLDDSVLTGADMEQREHAIRTQEVVDDARWSLQQALQP